MRTITSRRPFTLLGILLALLVIAAFVLVALNAGSANNSPTRSVVVANKDLQPRLPIEAASLAMKTIPIPSNYPDVYFTRIQDVQGKVPLVAIVSGLAVMNNEVVAPNQALGASSEFLPIPSGFVALTIPTSEQQGVANYIQPDDYISVIATVSLNGKLATKTIFTDLHVIKVGAQSSSATANASSLTVIVTECQAEFINWFLTYAPLKYTLESFHDYLQPGSQTKDPSCQSAGAAAAGKGVTLDIVKAAFPSLFQS